MVTLLSVQLLPILLTCSTRAFRRHCTQHRWPWCRTDRPWYISLERRHWQEIWALTWPPWCLVVKLEHFSRTSLAISGGRHNPFEDFGSISRETWIECCNMLDNLMNASFFWFNYKRGNHLLECLVDSKNVSSFSRKPEHLIVQFLMSKVWLCPWLLVLVVDRR
jgi:hypothetical protein